METKKSKRSRIVRTPANYSLVTKVPERKKTFTMKSETQPNESYTIQELFKKHAAGQMPAIGKEGQYTGTDDLDSEDLSKLGDADLFEKQEYAARFRQIAEDRKKAIDEDQTKRRQALEAEKKEFNDVKEFIKAQKQAPAKGLEKGGKPSAQE